MGSFPSKQLDDISTETNSKKKSKDKTIVTNNNKYSIPNQKEIKSNSTRQLNDSIHLTKSLRNQSFSTNNTSQLMISRADRSIYASYIEKVNLKDIVSDEIGTLGLLNYFTLKSKENVLKLYLSLKRYISIILNKTTKNEISSNEIDKTSTIVLDNNYLLQHVCIYLNDPIIIQIVSDPSLSFTQIQELINLIQNNINNIHINIINDKLLYLYNKLDIYIQDIELPLWKKTKYGKNYMTSQIKLINVIQDDSAMLFFEKFLAHEYSSENMDFYEAVKEYRINYNNLSDEINLHKAIYLLRLYISQEAPLQVNIPSRMRQRIERYLLKKNKTMIDIFKYAHEEILLLMSRDSWARYKRHNYWQEYLDYIPPNFDDNTNVLMEGYTSSYIRRQEFFEFIGDDDLMIVLSSKIGRDCLNKYNQVLRENNGSVGFWEDVKSYQNLPKDCGIFEKQIHAQVIYDKYISNTAAYPIYTSERIKIALEIAISNDKVILEDNIFDLAIEEMFEDFRKNDIFHKFKQTALYTKYRLLVKHPS